MYAHRHLARDRFAGCVSLILALAPFIVLLNGSIQVALRVMPAGPGGRSQARGQVRVPSSNRSPHRSAPASRGYARFAHATAISLSRKNVGFVLTFP